MSRSEARPSKCATSSFSDEKKKVEVLFLVPKVVHDPLGCQIVSFFPLLGGRVKLGGGAAFTENAVLRCQQYIPAQVIGDRPKSWSKGDIVGRVRGRRGWLGSGRIVGRQNDATERSPVYPSTLRCFTSHTLSYTTLLHTLDMGSREQAVTRHLALVYLHNILITPSRFLSKR